MSGNPFAFFKPEIVYIRPEAKEYPLARELESRFKHMGIPVRTGIPVADKTAGAAESYRIAKKTLVISVRRGLSFQSCKPSAHYQLPLATGCPALCEYCYLQTTLGPRPYLKVYVNVEEILAKAGEYITRRAPEVTVFEGAATSDPVPMEPLTHTLGKAVAFFAGSEHGRFRFVTKFHGLEWLAGLEHRDHTEVRISLNTRRVIRRFEKGASSLAHRIGSARDVLRWGYPLGLMIAPVLISEEWQGEYRDLLHEARRALGRARGISFEIVTHRYTARARELIQSRCPDHGLPLDGRDRKFKVGQFGYGKYVYDAPTMEQVDGFFRTEIPKTFIEPVIRYIV